MINKSISESEAKVLYALWDEAPMDGKQIAEKPSSESWSLVTIKTLINRLLNKVFLTYVKEGRRYLYSPSISKKIILKKKTNDF